jgi:hypothetical protein
MKLKGRRNDRPEVLTVGYLQQEARKYQAHTETGMYDRKGLQEFFGDLMEYLEGLEAIQAQASSAETIMTLKVEHDAPQ